VLILKNGESGVNLFPLFSMERKNTNLNYTRMDFLTRAKKRYSTRKYDNKPVEKEKLNRILEAARIAPSAVNKQPWIFVVIDEPVMLEKIHATYHREWFNDAPVVIVACTDHNEGWKRSDGKDHCDIDIAIAVDHMTLQAADEGLGTCWVCNFDPGKVNDVLKLPGNVEPAVLLPVGYPLDEANPDRHDAKRKKISEIVRWNKF
jgi:nitroreductase